MLSFEEGFIESQQLNQRLLQTIRLVGEYKGKQELFKQQAPQVLGTLRQAAVIQSTESSNRIEGITVSLEGIKKLVTEKNNAARSFRTINCGLSGSANYNSHQL
jgi:Fic family protein